MADEDRWTATSTEGPTWADIAGWYDDLLVAGSGTHDTARRCLLGLVPPLAGRQVLDVACGQGLASRALAAAGAEVVGIDSAEPMLERARAHGTPEGPEVRYVLDDAHHLATVADGSVDGVTCQLGLMDLPDLRAALAAVHRVLVPGGWFAFVIGHPVTLAPDAHPVAGPDGRPQVVLGDYFEERFWRSTNPQGVRRAGNHHRTLATYLNALVAAGFALERVDEPSASRLLADQQPVYARVPVFFGARVRRTS